MELLLLAVDPPLTAGPFDFLSRDGYDPGRMELAVGRHPQPDTMPATGLGALVGPAIDQVSASRPVRREARARRHEQGRKGRQIQQDREGDP